MKKNRTLKIILAFVLVLILDKSFAANKNRDFYLWNTVGAQIQLNQIYGLKVSSKTHYRVNDQYRDMTYFDLAVARKMNHWLKLGVAFRGAQLPKESGDIMEYRPQVFSNIGLNCKNIKFQTTNRMEHRSFSKGVSHYRYYHNIFVHFSSCTKWIKPYLGEELFTKLNSDGIHLGRIYGGIHLLEHEHFHIDLYYVWQQLKVDNKWQGADVFGVNMNLQI